MENLLLFTSRALNIAKKKFSYELKIQLRIPARDVRNIAKRTPDVLQIQFKMRKISESKFNQ